MSIGQRVLEEDVSIDFNKFGLIRIDLREFQDRTGLEFLRVLVLGMRIGRVG